MSSSDEVRSEILNAVAAELRRRGDTNFELTLDQVFAMISAGTGLASALASVASLAITAKSGKRDKLDEAQRLGYEKKNVGLLEVAVQTAVESRSSKAERSAAIAEAFRTFRG